MQQNRLVPMTWTALEDLYPVMQGDFPPEELKPLRRMRQLWDQGCYDPFFAEIDGRRRGYAILRRMEGFPYLLLDYLAIFREERNGGYGTQTLELLKYRYGNQDGIMAEVEDPDDARDEAERALRLRRVRFYQRAGFLPCPFPNSIFGVRYLVHVWTPERLPSRRLAAQCLAGLYLGHWPTEPVIQTPKVFLEIPEEPQA